MGQGQPSGNFSLEYLPFNETSLPPVCFVEIDPPNWWTGSSVDQARQASRSSLIVDICTADGRAQTLPGMPSDFESADGSRSPNINEP